MNTLRARREAEIATLFRDEGVQRAMELHGTPLLLLEQRISDHSRRVFEYTRIKFRGDRIRLEFDYDLTCAAR